MLEQQLLPAICQVHFSAGQCPSTQALKAIKFFACKFVKKMLTDFVNSFKAYSAVNLLKIHYCIPQWKNCEIWQHLAKSVPKTKWHLFQTECNYYNNWKYITAQQNTEHIRGRYMQYARNFSQVHVTIVFIQHICLLTSLLRSLNC